MASLAAVVQGYLTMAEKKTEAAKQEAIDKVGSAAELPPIVALVQQT